MYRKKTTDDYVASLINSLSRSSFACKGGMWESKTTNYRCQNSRVEVIIAAYYENDQDFYVVAASFKQLSIYKSLGDSLVVFSFVF